MSNYGYFHKGTYMVGAILIFNDSLTLIIDSYYWQYINLLCIAKMKERDFLKILKVYLDAGGLSPPPTPQP